MASYQHRDPTGRYQFHRPDDGREITVTGDKPYTTTDPFEIARLDACPFVRPAGKKTDGGDD